MTARFTRLPSGVLVADTATLVGDVVASPGVNVWFAAVVRGDAARITLGEGVNLQDGVVVHCDYAVPQVVEAGVVAGHAAVLHGVRVGRDTLVGIGARLLSGTVVGAECVIAAGAVVPPDAVIPPRSVVMGVPGKVVRAVTDAEAERTRATGRRYRELAERYANGEAT
jgi:carbonic anhydrase/acetyltransferase-like protein (isoleucine patch superfamily)